MILMDQNNDQVPYDFFNSPIRDYEHQVVDFLVELGKSRGQTDVTLKIIGYLLIHKNLTQEQLTELTGLSRGSISTNLNVMTSVGYIKKELIPGSSTYSYSFGGNLSQIASTTSFVKTEQNDLAIQFFQQKIAQLKGDNLQGKVGRDLLIERVKALIRFLEIRNKIVGLIKKSKFIKGLQNHEGTTNE